MKKSMLKRQSDERAHDNRVRAFRMVEKFGPREEWWCWFAGLPDEVSHAGLCFGEVNGHEILKRSRGGSITDMNNVVLLCNHHNGWVEDHPYAAEQLGLAKHSWEETTNKGDI